METSYSVLDSRGAAATHSFPEFLLRYGLSKRIELRLGWNFEVGPGGNDVSGSGAAEEFQVKSTSRDSRLLYGVKILVTENDGWIPQSSLIIQGYTPTSGEVTATQMSATYVFGWELPNRWKLDSAIRYDTDAVGGDHFSLWSPSAVLKVPVGERWSVHAEYFGRFSAGKETALVHHYFTPGVHYLITSDLEVGVRVGWGLNDQSDRFFANVGLGFRF